MNYKSFPKWYTIPALILALAALISGCARVAPLPPAPPTPTPTPVIPTPTPTPVVIVPTPVPEINIAQFNAAKKLYEDGEYGIANYEFQALLRAYPKSRQADLLTYYIGMCYQKLDLYPMARNWFQELLTNYPNSQWAPAAQVEIGYGYLDPKRPDYDKAYEAFTAVKTKYPQSEWVDNAECGLGYAALAQGKYADALAQFNLVLTNYPHSDSASKAQYGIAKVYEKQGKTREAQEIYAKILELWPNSEEAKLIKQIPPVTPTPVTPTPIVKPVEPVETMYNSAYATYQKGNYRDAIKKFQAVIDNYPTSVWVENSLYWIGVAYIDLGDYRTAIDYFDRVLKNPYYDKKDPDYHKKDDAQLSIANCYLWLRDYGKALLHYRKLIELYPQSEYVDRAQEKIKELESLSQ